MPLLKPITLFLLLILAIPKTFAMAQKISWEKAVDTAILRYGLRTEPELKQQFAKAQVSYPPQEVALLAFKKERKIELWAKNDGIPWQYIKNYPLTAFSGQLGPKLKEKDRQIPEGIYRLTNLNPFSSMHLSMQINYPNDFDKSQAFRDGRRHLGDNIFIHGKSLSVGCLAIGNWGIDQLFLLAREVGVHHVKLIIAPNDLRVTQAATSHFAKPRWLPTLYQKIRVALRPFHKHKSFAWR